MWTRNEHIAYADVRNYMEEFLSEREVSANNDEVFLMAIARFGKDSIKQDYFMSVLFRVLNDLGIAVPIDHNALKAYLHERLLHIPAIYYWASDQEKLMDAEVFFFGRCIWVDLKGSSRLIINLEQGPLDITAIPLNTAYSDIRYQIDINRTIFIAYERLKNDILRYFERINQSILKEVTQKVTMIRGQLSRIPPELTAMVVGLLDMLPPNLLLDRENYSAFEHLISFDNYYTKQFIDSSSSDIRRAVANLRENAKVYNTLQAIHDDTYTKFVRIIGPHLDILEEYHSSVAWTLIKTAATKHFAHQWAKEYGVHLKQEGNDLAQYVDLYCRSGDIPTKNIVAVGLFTYYLMDRGFFPEGMNSNFVGCNSLLIDKILTRLEKLELETFEKKLTAIDADDGTSYSINDIDLMDGREFEQFISLLFTKMGYQAEVTKGTGDQGLDVLAEKNGVKIGIQAKCYANKVTNKAVQEISAALNYYNCDKGMVITNNYFTDSAVELAASNNIMLWDRTFLKTKLEEVFM